MPKQKGNKKQNKQNPQQKQTTQNLTFDEEETLTQQNTIIDSINESKFQKELINKRAKEIKTILNQPNIPQEEKDKIVQEFDNLLSLYFQLTNNFSDLKEIYDKLNDNFQKQFNQMKNEIEFVKTTKESVKEEMNERISSLQSENDSLSNENSTLSKEIQKLQLENMKLKESHLNEKEMQEMICEQNNTITNLTEINRKIKIFYEDEFEQINNQREKIEKEFYQYKMEKDDEFKLKGIENAEKIKQKDDEIETLRIDNISLMRQLEWERMEKCEQFVNEKIKEKGIEFMEYSIDMSNRKETIFIEKSHIQIQENNKVELLLPFVTEKLNKTKEETIRDEWKIQSFIYDDEKDYYKLPCGSCLIENEKPLERNVKIVSSLKKNENKEEKIDLKDIEMKYQEELKKKEEMIENQRKQIEEMKKMISPSKEETQQNDSDKPEIIQMTIPIKYYITSEPINCDYKETSVHFSVNGEIEDGHQFYHKQQGQQRDLIVEVSMDTNNNNGTYQRSKENPSNLIQTLNFSKEYEGKQTQFSLQLPDESQQEIEFELIEGKQTEIKNKGLMKKDGTRGDLIIIIHLE